jgi:hypothetical protein
LALGGLFFAAIQWLTGAMWSAPLRRVAESFTSYLPVVALTFLGVVLGAHSIFEWTHPEFVKGDIILEGKAGYLNMTFFTIRNFIAIALWCFFAFKMIGRSLKQDATGDVTLTLKNKSLSPLFLIIFAITFTMASFDQIMSLDPHWFSTMLGVYCFSGLFYSTLALTAVVTIALKRSGLLAGIVNEHHLHDLGKFMFAFTVFWAYIAFSQYMLIWYANMPEETGFFMLRTETAWKWISLFLLIGKFMVPFFLLIQRGSKRSEMRLFYVAIFMLVAQWIDNLWLVQPSFFKTGPVFGWVEVVITLGFTGIFGYTVLRFLTRNNVVAIKDPKLAEAVFHHHV